MLFVVNKKDSQESNLCPEFDYDLYSLQREIDYFNSIIEYDDMWDLHDAQNRLKTGWKLVVFRPKSEVYSAHNPKQDDVIQGWGWLNTNNKEICNVYVNPKYRNKGIGVEIINSLHRYCQDWDKWWSQSDDWNKPAHKMLLNCNYKSIL